MSKNLARLLGALAALGLCALPAAAEITALPKDVQQGIAAMGPNLNGEIVGKTVALLKPLLPPSPPPGVTLTKDVSYGDDPLQNFDIYRPKGKNLPIAVFVHGGGFIGGDKSSLGPIYGNVTSYLARHGILALNANYRLAPKVQWPAQAQDVGAIVAWLKANAAQYGGDPARIVLIGHSAGATDVAQYVLDASLHPAGGTGVAGAVLVSGLYREAAVLPPYRAYFGDDASQYAKRLPASHVGEDKTPLFLVMAEYDPPFLAGDTPYLMSLVCTRDGKCPPLAWLKGHNHLSETMDIGTKDETLGRQLVEFIKAAR
ncbi:MAG TPA: alpha/beta hydrolase [Stellaceae bacterium]|nr:alpha/beta hydrolase [Stellaceae bacterium]